MSTKTEVNQKNELFSDDFQKIVREMDEKIVARQPRALSFYTPKLKAGATMKIVTLRFLPYFNPEGPQTPSIVDRTEHYVQLDSSELSGSYVCQKSVGQKCALCSKQYNLKNSQNVVDQERAKAIGWQPVHYVNILMINEPDQPELNGKILVYKFTKQVEDKIKIQEKMGVDVKSFKTGKDFNLTVTRASSFPSYVNSSFESSSFIKMMIGDKWVTCDTEALQAKFKAFYFDAMKNSTLHTFIPKPWDDITMSKVEDIIQFLTISSNLPTPPAPITVATTVADYFDDAAE